MSEIFRIHAPLDFAGLTMRELARLCHQAEDTDDDVLLLQVWDELERRGRGDVYLHRSIFMQHYNDLIIKGYKERK